VRPPFIVALENTLLRLLSATIVFALAAGIAGCSGAAPGNGTVPSAPAFAPENRAVETPFVLPSNVRPSCERESVQGARCYALQRTDVGDAINSSITAAFAPGVQPSGYGPQDLASAYKLPGGSAGAGQTVAVVDAFDNPNAEVDLGVYRAHYGLPACTTANGCFKKVNQNGVRGSYPKSDPGWGQEESLDLDMVSAVCPNCHVILVEVSSSFEAGVDAAVKLGATEVSNSYRSPEFNASEAAYIHPGIPITASAGDSGYRTGQPASYATVIAVGGTTLTRSSSARGWTETVWGGTGSGCSTKVAKPSWQSGSVFQCAKRTMNDVAAIGDPETGVAIYDSYGKPRQTGWLEFGGTSVSSPIIAAVYALSGTATSVNDASGIYAHPTLFNDVTKGHNGRCAIAYLCNGEVGYDGPTGLGTPIGPSGL
jgi:subtilase family serine protease